MMNTLLILLSVWFCSPTGNGNGTTYTTPCSLSTGIGHISSPGDTLYLLGGQYDLGKTTVSGKIGSSSANIVISGYPGETAILDFRTTPYGTRGLQIGSDCRYVHIKDMTLRYSGKNNLYNEGSYCTFEHLDIYGSSDTGCQMKNGGNNLIINVDSHDNFDYEHYGTNGADFGGNADGFADKQFTGAGNHYIGCRSWNNSDDGWDFFQRESTSETIIEDCICYMNGPAEYDMRNHPRYQTDRTWFDDINGSTITNRYGVEQVVTLEHYPCHGNGNGFKLGGKFTTHNVLIHHCLAVANTVRGFDQNNNFGQMRVFNNTGYKNGIDFGFGNTDGGTLTIRNNISYQSMGANSYVVQTVVANDHNSWNTGFSATAADFVSTDTTHILDARQADGSLPVMTLLHLTSASALRDAGINVGLTYNGSAPDLGCYESDGEYHPAEEPEPEPEPEPYICKEGSHRVAYVTIPESAADNSILNWLYGNDSLCIEITSATDANVDYSPYELIIVSGVPNSSAAGISPLKTVNKPKLVLKSFMLKSGVWGWCTANNTSLASVEVVDTAHTIFHGLSTPLALFSQVSTNGITTMTGWQVQGHTTLATANGGQDAIVEMTGEPTLIIGISEYSYAHLTQDALNLIENSACYLLGIEKPARSEDPETPIDPEDPNQPDPEQPEEPTQNISTYNIPTRTMLIRDGRICILRGTQLYDLTGIMIGEEQ